MKPGEIITNQGTDFINANEGLDTILVKVSNSGDRPIQVGSHMHFFEVNRALEFDRDMARGFRLNVPAGTAARFRTRRFKGSRTRCPFRETRGLWAQ